MTTVRAATPAAVITAQDTFTEAFPVDAGDLVALSAFRNAFTGVYTLQRRLDGVNWRDVTDDKGVVSSWTGVDLEVTYKTDAGGELRLGVKTGDHAGTDVTCQLFKG